MDDVTVLAAAACAMLAILVYLMWRDATRSGWSDMSQAEKKRWREEEAKRAKKP